MAGCKDGVGSMKKAGDEIFARRRISRLSYGLRDGADLGTRYAVLMQTTMMMKTFVLHVSFCFSYTRLAAFNTVEMWTTALLQGLSSGQMFHSRTNMMRPMQEDVENADSSITSLFTQCGGESSNKLELEDHEVLPEKKGIQTAPLVMFPLQIPLIPFSLAFSFSFFPPPSSVSFSSFFSFHLFFPSPRNGSSQHKLL